jgi:hypothetical protein
VIVIAGARDKWLERKMVGLGAKSFLNKPVRFETLRGELANYVDILAAPGGCVKLTFRPRADVIAIGEGPPFGALIQGAVDPDEHVACPGSVGRGRSV